MAEVRKRIADARLSVTVSLLTGYAAFGGLVGASGVLAAVTAGIYMGIRGPQILPARACLQGYFAALAIIELDAVAVSRLRSGG